MVASSSARDEGVLPRHPPRVGRRPTSAGGSDCCLRLLWPLAAFLRLVESDANAVPIPLSDLALPLLAAIVAIRLSAVSPLLQIAPDLARQPARLPWGLSRLRCSDGLASVPSEPLPYPVKRSTVRRAISTLLAVIGLVGTAWACAAASPALTACPAQAAGTVTQLYRWAIAAGDTYREHLDQQVALFEPGLYQHLQAAFRLQPKAGAVLDFDPFNGAQVSSYGFRLEGCRVNGAQLVARL